ncbi:MAG: hypothetical protein P8Y70_01545 [Candidatus Lokiarchaeota archaeon]
MIFLEYANSWLYTIPISIIFGLALFLTIYLKGNYTIFMIWLSIFSGIFVTVGLIDNWIFITIFTVSLIVIGYGFIQNRNNNNDNEVVI